MAQASATHFQTWSVGRASTPWPAISLNNLTTPTANVDTEPTAKKTARPYISARWGTKGHGRQQPIGALRTWASFAALGPSTPSKHARSAVCGFCTSLCPLQSTISALTQLGRTTTHTASTLKLSHSQSSYVIAILVHCVRQDKMVSKGEFFVLLTRIGAHMHHAYACGARDALGSHIILPGSLWMDGTAIPGTGTISAVKRFN